MLGSDVAACARRVRALLQLPEPEADGGVGVGVGADGQLFADDSSEEEQPQEEPQPEELQLLGAVMDAGGPRFTPGFLCRVTVHSAGGGRAAAVVAGLPGRAPGVWPVLLLAPQEGREREERGEGEGEPKLLWVHFSCLAPRAAGSGEDKALVSRLRSDSAFRSYVRSSSGGSSSTQIGGRAMGADRMDARASASTAYWRGQYESNAGKHWNKFYGANGGKFFKVHTYIRTPAHKDPCCLLPASPPCCACPCCESLLLIRQCSSRTGTGLTASSRRLKRR